MIESKYFKPKSLTWWASLAPLSAGVTVATAPLHGFTDLSDSIQSITYFSPPELITTGLAGIGLRGAIKPAEPE